MLTRLLFLVIFLYGTSATGSGFGERGLAWSQQDSSAFQDYAVRTLNAQNRIINDYWLHYWLQQKISTLQFTSNVDIPKLYPISLRDNSVNAFAMPGNVMGFHQGLWVFADNEDEFLAVLAHEMAHVGLNHFSRIQDNRAESTLMIASGILASILISNASPELANATLVSSIAAANQDGLRFSQSMELEADQLARELLENAGYTANSARTFFLRLQMQSNDGGVYEFLRTHPLGSTRAARIEPSQNQRSNRITDFDWLRFARFNKSHDDISALLAEKKPITGQGPWPWLVSTDYLYKFKQTDLYIKELNELLEQHPGFLPAQAELLNQMMLLQQDVCSVWQQNPNQWSTAFVTTDVLDTVTEVLRRCDPVHAIEWQAKRVWQSGQPVDALALLSNQLKTADSENQSARLRALYEQYQNLYQRYR